MMWHVLATVCMLDAPADCATQNLTKGYPALHACLEVLAQPFKHLSEMPTKVEGSRWIKIGCERR